MSEIRRYKCGTKAEHGRDIMAMFTDPSGHWVTYDDHVASVAAARDAGLVDALAAVTSVQPYRPTSLHNRAHDRDVAAFRDGIAGAATAIAALRATPPAEARFCSHHKTATAAARCPNCVFPSTPPEAGAELAVGDRVVLAPTFKGDPSDGFSGYATVERIDVTVNLGGQRRATYWPEDLTTAPSPLAGPQETGGAA